MLPTLRIVCTVLEHCGSLENSLFSFNEVYLCAPILHPWGWASPILFSPLDTFSLAMTGRSYHGCISMRQILGLNCPSARAREYTPLSPLDPVLPGNSTNFTFAAGVYRWRCLTLTLGFGLGIDGVHTVRSCTQSTSSTYWMY